MGDILPQEKLVNKEQISRILDIEPDIDLQNEHKQTIYILNGALYEVPEDMTTDQCLELVKLKKVARKKNHSNETEDQTDYSVDKSLFGKKDVIYIDRQEGDSLQKLALTFNCSIAEIKFANKIYNEQELHALRTVKIPVVKDGTLYHEYNKNKNTQTEGTFDHKENLNPENKEASSSHDDNSYKYKFGVQKPYAVEPNLSYLSDDGSEYDIYEVGMNEKEGLLADKTVFINKVNTGYPVNISDSTLPDFMNKMDEKIKKGIEELESKNENLEGTLDKQVVFSMERKSSQDVYGTLCSFSWKHFVVLVCLLAVVIPLIYFIYFLKNRHI